MAQAERQRVDLDPGRHPIGAAALHLRDIPQIQYVGDAQIGQTLGADLVESAEFGASEEETRTDATSVVGFEVGQITEVPRARQDGVSVNGHCRTVTTVRVAGLWKTSAS
ncbi:MAG TPA: hypothetical protein VIQ49_12375 [Williamsia sp.]